MEFDPWVLFTDLGWIFLLLLVGKLLRAKLKPVQVLFLPASIIAGLLGLLLGVNGLGVIPFSDQISVYPAVLIAVIFAALPLGATFDLSSIAGRVGALWSYSQAMYIMMWGAGLVFALAVLGLIWDLPSGFGAMLASGFVGGHGTAAAVGAAFQDLGFEEAQSLAFTAATVGVIAAILGGLALIKWGARTGRTNILADFSLSLIHI
jgi:ESS family glutamate:Na+ symporter